MDWRSPLSLLVVSLLAIPLLADHPNPSHAYPRSPHGFAEKLIRGLNLVPGIHGIDVAQEATADPSTPRLVERKLDFEILGDSGTAISVEELGHHAGYYRLERTHAARLFYFFFESRGSRSDPVVLWLTGGQGCSSNLALFYENGPFSIADNMSLLWNDYGWDKASNLIYVDQPTGTGFSYSTDLRDLRFNEKGISNDLYDFLQAFFMEHPEYLKNEFYITGESYAGHYIPAVARRVQKGNKDKEGLYLNLKGLAIDDGLTDPAIQFTSYTDYAYEMGLIGKSAHDIISKINPLCILGAKLCDSFGGIACLASYTVCNSIFTSIMFLTGNINYYDIRKQCQGELCYDFSNIEKFLNQKSVRDALGVGNRTFKKCNPLLSIALSMDTMKNFEVGIPSLIDDGIKLLIYVGEYDLVCNWLGNFRWVNSMDWSGHQNFTETPMSIFTVDGAEAGLLKTFGPLSFLKVHDAGHLVPMDQPKASLEMLKRWMKGKLGEELGIPTVAEVQKNHQGSRLPAREPDNVHLGICDKCIYKHN